MLGFEGGDEAATNPILCRERRAARLEERRDVADELLVVSVHRDVRGACAARSAADSPAAPDPITTTSTARFTAPLRTPGKPGSTSCFFIMSIKNGKFVAPDGARQIC